MQTEIRNCRIHGDTEHALYVSGRHKQWKCLKCQVASTYVKRAKLKLKAVDYKGGKCEICGYDKNLSALEFHHVNPESKEFAVSVDGYKYSWERNQKELDKCILVCSNCHRELHNPQQTKEHILEALDYYKNIDESTRPLMGKVCPVCGKRFRSVTGKIYCSKECREEAQK